MIKPGIAAPVLWSAALLAATPALAQTSTCDTTGVWRINDVQTVRGASIKRKCNIVIGTNGSLQLTNRAKLIMESDYDEEHSITIEGNGTLKVVDSTIRPGTNGNQFFILLQDDGKDAIVPKLNVSGQRSLITLHSGIRAYGRSTVTVTGGDVEEIGIHDQARVYVKNASTYPAFYPGRDATMAISLRASESVTTVIPTQPTDATFRFEMVAARIESGFQIDTEAGSDITVKNSTNVVLSIRTPGDLGDRLRILDGVTGPAPYSRRFDDVGAKIGIENSQVDLLNVYTFGADRVLIRNSLLNEINANDSSEMIVGDADSKTTLVCNLCQAYGSANLNVFNTTMAPDDPEFQPSVTAGIKSVSDTSTFRFANTSLLGVPGDDENPGVLPTRLEVINHGTLLLDAAQFDKNHLEVGPDGRAEVRAISSHFAPSRLVAAVQETVEFINLSAGDIQQTQWDFGDGEVSSERSPSHIYTTPGTYTVRLQVVNAGGEAATTERVVTVATRL